jgi:hypothetical protein
VGGQGAGVRRGAARHHRAHLNTRTLLLPLSAHTQGNTARFINHSCEPNCETQKWMVQGELAIGLFTLRKIKAGEQCSSGGEAGRGRHLAGHAHCSVRGCSCSR